jgi:hypothetical protein
MLAGFQNLITITTRLLRRRNEVLRRESSVSYNIYLVGTAIRPNRSRAAGSTSLPLELFVEEAAKRGERERVV